MSLTFLPQFLSKAESKFTKTKKTENKHINWDINKLHPSSNKKIKWIKIEDKSFFESLKSYNKQDYRKDFYSLGSMNRSISFGDGRIGPDISLLVPPGFSWNKLRRFDASVRGHNRRKNNENFLGWNGGDAVGQFYYQFFNSDKYSYGINFGMRSVYSGKGFVGGSTSIGEGLSAGFRWDNKLSEKSGISIGAEQLLHFDGLTDTGRDIYLTYSKGWWTKGFDGAFPLYVFTGGVGTGKLSEGAIKGLCGDLLGGAGTNTNTQNRLCWAPIFSFAKVFNESFSSFIEYNSHSLILGSSYAPSQEIPLRGTFAIKLADEDNYEINSFSEMTWVFRLSLGF